MTTTHVTAEGLVERILAGGTTGRRLIAITGSPGSGKSTFAERLQARIDARVPGVCAVLPMDGYHFDDALLTERGDRPRKGAPHTFDTGGLRSMLERLAADAEDEVAVPVFDRSIEIARAGARIIARRHRFILVEGNYLLLDDPRWTPMQALFDATVMLDVPEAVLRARLHERWIGLGLSGAALAAKLEGNDFPNMRMVIERSVDPDYRIANA